MNSWYLRGPAAAVDPLPSASCLARCRRRSRCGWVMPKPLGKPLPNSQDLELRETLIATAALRLTQADPHASVAALASALDNGPPSSCWPDVRHGSRRVMALTTVRRAGATGFGDHSGSTLTRSVPRGRGSPGWRPEDRAALATPPWRRGDTLRAASAAGVRSCTSGTGARQFRR